MKNRKSLPMYAAEYVDQICPVLERFITEHSIGDSRQRRILAAANATAIATVAKLLMKQRNPSDEMREAIEILADEIVLAKTGVRSRHEPSSLRDGRHRGKANWATSRWTAPLPVGAPIPIDCTPAELMDVMEPMIDILLGLMGKFLEEIKLMKAEERGGVGAAAVMAAFVAVAKLTLSMSPDRLGSFIETIAEHRASGMATSMEQRLSMS